MPIVSDPKATFKYVLVSDQDKPEKKRPTFLIRTLTLSQWRGLSATAAQLADSANADKIVDAAEKIVRTGVTGWVNMPDAKGKIIDFDKAAIDKVVGIEELMELAMAVINQQPTPEDKKKLSSPSPSASGTAARKSVRVKKRVKRKSTRSKT